MRLSSSSAAFSLASSSLAVNFFSAGVTLTTYMDTQPITHMDQRTGGSQVQSKLSMMCERVLVAVNFCQLPEGQQLAALGLTQTLLEP